MKAICQNCKWWKNEFEFKIPDEAQCALTQSNFSTFDERLHQAYPFSKAYARIDRYGRGVLYTHNSFGCVQFDPKEG